MNFVVGVDPATTTSTAGGTVMFIAPKETHVSIKALNDIAQELDELSDEMPALADLSERIGRATEALEQTLDRPQVTQRRPDEDMPRYLREIHSIVQREVHGAYRLQGMNPDLAATEVYRMQVERDLRRPLPPVNKILAGITGV